LTASFSAVFFEAGIFFTEAFCWDAGAFAAAFVGELFLAGVRAEPFVLLVAAAGFFTAFFVPVAPAGGLAVVTAAFFAVAFAAVFVAAVFLATVFLAGLFAAVAFAVVFAGAFEVAFEVDAFVAVVGFLAAGAFVAADLLAAALVPTFFAGALVAADFVAVFAALVADLAALFAGALAAFLVEAAFFAVALPALVLVAGAFFALVLVAGAFFAEAFLAEAFLASEDAAAFALREVAAAVVPLAGDLRPIPDVTRLAAAAVLSASFFAVDRAMAAGPPIQPVLCGDHHTRAARICLRRRRFKQTRKQNRCVFVTPDLADLAQPQGVDGTSSPCTTTSDPGTV
jgi:hypothetical protein